MAFRVLRGHGATDLDCLDLFHRPLTTRKRNRGSPRGGSFPYLCLHHPRSPRSPFHQENGLATCYWFPRQCFIATIKNKVNWLY